MRLYLALALLIGSYMLLVTCMASAQDWRDTEIARLQDEVATLKARLYSAQLQPYEPGPNNQVSLMIGIGPSGLDVTSEPNRLQVTEKQDSLLGLQYQRKLNNRVSIGTFGLTNNTIGATMGVGF